METYNRRYRLMTGHPAIIWIIAASYDTLEQAKRAMSYRLRQTHREYRFDIIDSTTGETVKSFIPARFSGETHV